MTMFKSTDRKQRTNKGDCRSTSKKTEDTDTNNNNMTMFKSTDRKQRTNKGGCRSTSKETEDTDTNNN